MALAMAWSVTAMPSAVRMAPMRPRSAVFRPSGAFFRSHCHRPVASPRSYPSFRYCATRSVSSVVRRWFGRAGRGRARLWLFVASRIALSMAAASAVAMRSGSVWPAFSQSVHWFSMAAVTAVVLRGMRSGLCDVREVGRCAVSRVGPALGTSAVRVTGEWSEPTPASACAVTAVTAGARSLLTSAMSGDDAGVARAGERAGFLLPLNVGPPVAWGMALATVRS